MSKIRVQSLAKELKVDVLQLMQHLKDDMGLQVTYLSTLDEGTASQVRQLLSQEAAHCSVRFSLSRYTTEREIEETIMALEQVLKEKDMVRLIPCK